jgi:hypothetical protein
LLDNLCGDLNREPAEVERRAEAAIGFHGRVSLMRCYFSNTATLPDVHALEVVFPATSDCNSLQTCGFLEFKIVEWAHVGLAGTDSDRLLEGERCFRHGRILVHWITGTGTAPSRCLWVPKLYPVDRGLFSTDWSSSVEIMLHSPRRSNNVTRPGSFQRLSAPPGASREFSGKWIVKVSFLVINPRSVARHIDSAMDFAAQSEFPSCPAP